MLMWAEKKLNRYQQQSVIDHYLLKAMMAKFIYFNFHNISAESGVHDKEQTFEPNRFGSSS